MAMALSVPRLTAAVLLLTVVFVSACDITVDPASHTLHDATDALARILSDRGEAQDLAASSQGDVTVCLLPGVHSLGGRPLRLTSEHSSPTRRVTWVGVGDAPAVVSGGVQVTGWKKAASVPGVGANTFVAPLPSSVLDSAVPTVRQMWVNGVRANRTTLSPVPKMTQTAYGFDAATVLSWPNPSTVEFVWPETVRNWIAPRCTLTNVTAVAGGSSQVYVKPDCWQFLLARAGGKVVSPTVIENARLPQTSGEFYVDMAGKVVYYTAASSVTDPSSIDAWMPAQQTLVNGTGLTGHTWSGVTFSYSTWLGPNSDSGYVGSQTGVHTCAASPTAATDDGLAVRSRVETTTTLRGGEVTATQCEPVGALHFEASSSLAFEDCVFTKHGAQYALSVGSVSQKVSVSKCQFQDMSGGAVKFANVDNTRAVTTDPSQWDTDYAMSNSTTSNSANEYWGCATLFLGYVRGANIVHNGLDLCGYTGVSLGWGWGSIVSFAADNVVSGNRITRVMTRLVDGGGIYTLGPQPNSVVSENYVDADENKFGVFYHDNGSRYFNTTNNVAANSPLGWAFFLQGCCGKPALDIHVNNFWWKSCSAPENNCKAQGCTDTNVFEMQASDPWPAAAQAIIDAAGPM